MATDDLLKNFKSNFGDDGHIAFGDAGHFAGRGKQKTDASLGSSDLEPTVPKDTRHPYDMFDACIFKIIILNAVSV